MVTYCSYRVAPDGCFVGASSFFEADDDGAALAQATRDVTPTLGIEVWLNDRKIGRLPPQPRRRVAGGRVWHRGPGTVGGTLWHGSSEQARGDTDPTV